MVRGTDTRQVALPLATHGGVGFLSDDVEAADVGIDDGEEPSSSPPSSDDELSPKSGGRRRLLPARAFTRITYVHIHQCDDFSVRERMNQRAAATDGGFGRPSCCFFVARADLSSDPWRVRHLVFPLADGRVLLPGGRDAAAARPPGDGGPEQAPLRLRARALLRLGRRHRADAAALRREEMRPGEGGGGGRGAPRAVRGVGAVPAERRQPARVHGRDAVRHPRRAHAALLGGARPAVDLLRRRLHPVPPR